MFFKFLNHDVLLGKIFFNKSFRSALNNKEKQRNYQISFRNRIPERTTVGQIREIDETDKNKAYQDQVYQNEKKAKQETGTGPNTTRRRTRNKSFIFWPPILRPICFYIEKDIFSLQTLQ